MSQKHLNNIDLKKYAKWICRLGGKSVSVFFCDATGELIFPSDDAELQEKIGALIQEKYDWWANSGEVGVLEKHQLIFRPMLLRTGEKVGVVGLVLDLSSGGNFAEIDQFAEIIGDMAQKIEEECEAQSELDSMAGELSSRYEELILLFNLNQALNLSDSCSSIVERLLKDTVLHMNISVMAYIEPRAKVVVHVENPDENISNLDLILAQLRGDLFRYLSSSKEVLIVNDPKDARRDFIFRNFPYKIMASPVFADGAVISTLVMLSDLSKPDFDSSDRRICETIAAQVSSLFRMRSLIDEMDRFNIQMAAALIEAVEAKDPYTRGHSERVNKISMEIGKSIGLTRQQLSDLHWGSLLHDIGKIGVPDSVLCKPDKLTRDEYMVICCHPERSYEILRHIDRLHGALPAARYHQERFDGKGYPHGLSGADIPLLARITAVADTYDSITSSRAYRPGRSHQFAMEEIKRSAGSQLDPEIVDCFVSLCETESEMEHLRKILSTADTPIFYSDQESNDV